VPPKLTSRQHPIARMTVAPRHILLCMEQDTLLLRTREMLLESDGYTVLTARSLTRCLTLLRDFPIDCVLLGYTAPESALKEAIGSLRGINPQVPILLLMDLPGSTPLGLPAPTFFEPSMGPSRLLEAVAALTGQAKPVTFVSRIAARMASTNQRAARK